MEPQYLSFKHNNKPLYLRKARKQNKISTHHKAVVAKYALAKSVINDLGRPVSYFPGNIERQMVRGLRRY